MNLTDELWALLEPLIPIKQRADGKGRPSTPPRPVLVGIFWILRTGGLPERYPPYQTCHRHFQKWADNGVFSDILVALQLTSTSGVASTFQNASLTAPSCRQKKGLLCWEKPSPHLLSWPLGRRCRCRQRWLQSGRRRMRPDK